MEWRMSQHVGDWIFVIAKALREMTGEAYLKTWQAILMGILTQADAADLKM